MPWLIGVEVPAPALVLALAVPTAVAVWLGLRLRAARAEERAAAAELARTQRRAGGEKAKAREERARLERALDAIPQGVLITDSQGRVVLRNRVAETFSSARHSDALVEAAIAELVTEALAGRNVTRTINLFGPPRRTLVIATTPLSPRGESPEATEGEPEVALTVAAGPPGPANGPSGALAVVDDISERRRLEATRRDFVANISHELKTPVGAIGLLAETLLSEDDQAVANRLAERIVNEAFRLGHTIDDLLVLSRIESEEAPERESVPVHLVVAESVERIRPAAEQAGIEIVVEEPAARLGVFGDRRQLTSALYNLLDNAVKYSDRSSAVTVAASTDGRDVAISVVDHGIGIPRADLERVFERFYRVDAARSRATGGTGLGLAIVRHVATNHQGEVLVDSRLGEGSTFTLVLPSASGPVALPGDDDATGGLVDLLPEADSA